MRAFWKYAAEMLHFRGSIVLAIVGALVAAGCFGAGIGTIPIIFKVMLGDQQEVAVVQDELRDPTIRVASDDSETNFDNQGDPIAFLDTDGNELGQDATETPQRGRNLQQLLKDADQRVFGLVPNAWIAAAPTDRLEGIVVVLIGIFFLTVIGATAKFIHGYFAMSAGIRTVAMLRERAFRHILHLPLQSIVSDGVADRMSRIVKDTNRLRNGFNSLSTRAIGESLKGTAALVVALILNWQLTLIAIVAAPVLALVIRKFSKRVQKASKRALRASGVMLGAMTEAVHGIRVVKVHTAESHEGARFRRINTRLMQEELSMRLAKAMSSPVIELLTMVGIIAITILSAWYILSRDVGYDEVLATLIAVATAGASVRPLTQISTEIHESAAAAERLDDLMSEPVEMQVDERLDQLALHAHSIEFDHVSFRYAEAEGNALDRVSLKIRHGETVAFVGPNGSGKTTLLGLIPRLFEPADGAILIDGTDLKRVQLKSIREQIGVVTQETVVFHDTIANNIAYGLEDVTFDEVTYAAEQAHADEFIRRKPAGYDTMVGEQGSTLSGGERQRIAIARAILRNPRILILDEATSMIDAESESQIAAALDEFCRDRTSLVIAHRLSTVVHADRIVVLNRGSIVDVGRHEELLGRCTLYQQLCRTQLVDGHGSPDPTVFKQLRASTEASVRIADEGEIATTS